MNKKRTLIFVILLIVLMLGILSIRLYASTNEKAMENTINEFFCAFYDVLPDTIDLIIPNNTTADADNQSVVKYKKYAESTYKGLYTKNFYETFLVGDRYLIMAPQIASDNDLTISCKNIELTATESSGSDKYYDFTVEIALKDNVLGTEEILINKGQIRIKQDYFKYKIHSIKFFDDKLVKYLK